VKHEQSRGQRCPLAVAGMYRRGVGAGLGQVGISLAQWSEPWEEYESLAEDPSGRESQRIAYTPVVMLVGQDRAELGFGEELNRELGDVHLWSQVAHAEGLRS